MDCRFSQNPFFYTYVSLDGAQGPSGPKDTYHARAGPTSLPVSGGESCPKSRGGLKSYRLARKRLLYLKGIRAIKGVSGSFGVVTWPA